MQQNDLIHALYNTQLFAQLSRKKPVFFLDYDGTLTPIVKHPEHAVLCDSMRSVLGELAEYYTVTIISGRDRKDVKNLVGLNEVIYAGSHGFDISGPGDMKMQHEKGIELLPVLDEVQKKLEVQLADIRGCQVERKKFSIAIHYRNVPEEKVSEIASIVDKIHNEFTGLRKNHGKKIIELQPDIPWNKGKAVLWLLDHLELHRNTYIPVYLGDDLTDEHAFDVLQDFGVAILVGDHGHETKANYVLKDSNEVEDFLNRIIQLQK